MNAYLDQLTKKTKRLNELLAPFSAPTPQVFDSPETHYRMRAEFRIWRNEAGIHYAMSQPGETISSRSVILMENFPAATQSINEAMPKLLKALKADELLSHKLYQVEFLATLAGDMLITLIYHCKLGDAWKASAEKLQDELSVFVIGRSRGQKMTLSQDYVSEILNVDDAQFQYHQYEQSFSQPNAVVCQKMLTWACTQVGKSNKDLLELYCGNGNFTLPLSRHFRKTLATEVSKSGIKALRENLLLNKIDNIAVARLSAEEFAEAFSGKHEFTRLKQDNILLNNYDFDCVLVDPPRAGIDADTLALLSHFPRILYISCNPETLAENLQSLTKTHQIEQTALFDQFPFTPHLESGVYLTRRPFTADNRNY